ncbi:hypothetical protein KGQ34_04490 [Patescibacteria group bacterium]|nr:hypothetical protein [Patescibacteria group bacterium]
MPDIKNAPIQFVCETPSLWFFKVYLAETWQVRVMGHDKQEMIMVVTSQDKENIFVFIPTTGAWKNVSDLKDEKIEELLKKTFGSQPTNEDGL